MRSLHTKHQTFYKYHISKNLQYLLKSYISIIIGIVIILYVGNRGTVTIENFLLYILGGVNSRNISAMLDIIMFSLPFITYMIVFGNIIGEDFGRASVYIFSRTNNKNTWLAKKIILLFLCTIIYFSFLIATLSVCMVMKGILFLGSAQFISFVFHYFINSVLNYFLVLLITNLLTIFYRNIAVIYSTIIAFYYATQFILTPGYGKLATWAIGWPSVHSLLFLHNIPSLKLIDEAYFLPSSNLLTSAVSFTYQALLIYVTIYIGKKTIRTFDLLA